MYGLILYNYAKFNIIPPCWSKIKNLSRNLMEPLRWLDIVYMLSGDWNQLRHGALFASGDSNIVQDVVDYK